MNHQAPQEETPSQTNREIEYQELCESWRHDDNWFNRFSAIVLPLSVIGLIVPYTENQAAGFLTCLFGILGMFYWYFSARNYQARSDIRWERIREIEDELDFDAHRRIHRMRQQRGIKMRHRHWRLVIFIVYLIFAVIILLLSLFRIPL